MDRTTNIGWQYVQKGMRGEWCNRWELARGWGNTLLAWTRETHKLLADNHPCFLKQLLVYSTSVICQHRRWDLPSDMNCAPPHLLYYRFGFPEKDDAHSDSDLPPTTPFGSLSLLSYFLCLWEQRKGTLSWLRMGSATSGQNAKSRVLWITDMNVSTFHLHI